MGSGRGICTVARIWPHRCSAPLHYRIKLSWASLCNRYIFSAGIINCTAVFVAAAFGNFDCVKELVARHADILVKDRYVELISDHKRSFSGMLRILIQS